MNVGQEVDTPNGVGIVIDYHVTSQMVHVAFNDTNSLGQQDHDWFGVDEVEEAI